MDLFGKDYDKINLNSEEGCNQIKDLWSTEMEQILASHTPYIKVRKKKNLLLRLLFILLISLITLSVLTTMLLGKGWLGNRLGNPKHISMTIPVVEKPQADPELVGEDGRYTTIGLAKTVSPSIVSIVTYESGNGFTPSSQGSGIIMTEDGYILTNAHVIQNATFAIKVILDNGDEYEAQVIGSDERTDIAVIKISAQKLQPVVFGDSNQTIIGEEVVAIGNPAGYGGSVTKGIVSGLNRMISTDYTNKAMSCIQIDAAINPGNSGGALFNMYGQVIGITSSKIAASEYDGIGFAIAFDAAKPIVEKLIEKGFVDGDIRVGITFYGVTKTTADMANAVPGLYVVGIAEDCDVYNSGLEVNDIITKVNGQLATDLEELMEILKDSRPGDEVEITVYRIKEGQRGEYIDLKFKLMEYKSSIIEN